MEFKNLLSIFSAFIFNDEMNKRYKESCVEHKALNKNPKHSYTMGLHLDTIAINLYNNTISLKPELKDIFNKAGVIKAIKW